MKKFLIATLAISSSLLAYTYDEEEKIYEFDAGERFTLSCAFKGKALNCSIDDFRFTFKEVTYVKADESGDFVFSKNKHADFDDWMEFNEALLLGAKRGNFRLTIDSPSNDLEINCSLNIKNKRLCK